MKPRADLLKGETKLITFQPGPIRKKHREDPNKESKYSKRRNYN